MRRPPAIHHCTSLPLQFFGRSTELALLDEALDGGAASVVAFVGPGGQGKTAIVQHWLQSRASAIAGVDGLFLWSFYRGKDSDICLRELFAYAEGFASPPEVSASFCVDRLVPRLRRERWAIVFDGAEVVQHEQGAWRGRFLHPELGRLVETLAEAPMPGVVAMTTRFEVPTLVARRHARLVSLTTLDEESGVALLRSLGVTGAAEELQLTVRAGGGHAKAVELLGTWLRHFREAQATARTTLPELPLDAGSEEERHVLRVLAAFHATLPEELKDILALTTAFRQPPTEACLIPYLSSEPVRHLLHDGWGRRYPPFGERAPGWLAARIQELVELRLLELVSLSLTRSTDAEYVLDAHPLVRRGFEDVLGGGSANALARAGFLRGRPDRQKPATLAEAREDVELFHAYCDAGLWSEADSTLRGLDNPKHRFLAPAFERDLLLRFFPAGDWRQPPLWSGFGRRRSLAICSEMLGQFEEALDLYPAADAPLRGDALLALGRLKPLLDGPQAPHPWQSLWQAYRAHAFCLAGRSDEALAVARTAIPLDIYEWVHLFEALLRLGQEGTLDLRSLEAQGTDADASQWALLARRRLRVDQRRRAGPTDDPSIAAELRELIDAYDRAGLPWERALARLSLARQLIAVGDTQEALAVAERAGEIALRHQMAIVEADALAIRQKGGAIGVEGRLSDLRQGTGFLGPFRP